MYGGQENSISEYSQLLITKRYRDTDGTSKGHPRFPPHTFLKLFGRYRRVLGTLGTRVPKLKAEYESGNRWLSGVGSSTLNVNGTFTPGAGGMDYLWSNCVLKMYSETIWPTRYWMWPTP